MANKIKRQDTPPKRTAPAHVSSPTVPGAVENIERVIDTIDAMRRRKQITDRQFRAAEACRHAYDVVYGQVGGSMDPDRVRGAGLPGSPPPPAVLFAAETLNSMRSELYDDDHAIVVLIVCEQRSVEECTAILLGSLERSAREDVGRRLKVALTELARCWMISDHSEGSGEKQEGALMSWIAPGELPRATDIQEVPKARAVHATSHRIYHTGR